MNKFTYAMLPVALAATAAVGQVPAGDSDIRTRLASAGYAEVREVEFEDGVWEAEVRRADGGWGEIAFDAANGEVFDSRDGRALLDARGITQALEAAGYTEIGDLDRDGALWDAEARAPDGTRVELRLSGVDGRVLHSDVEYRD